jgi:predicted dehydrogenase
MKRLVFLFLVPIMMLSAQDKPIRVGIIGLDTSHVIEFTRILNDTSHAEHVPGARVVAGFKGGSPDVEASATRVEKFTAQLRDEWKVEIVPDIPTLCSKVDAVLLTSVDGRTHLAQIRPVIHTRKPVFIDKPLAASLADAKVGEILGCDAFSPYSTEPHHPDLFWYGIHGVEMLYTLMGQGCESVVRVSGPGSEVVVGRWKDGRLGTFRGIREGKTGYGATVFGKSGVVPIDAESGSLYRGLMEEIIRFFRTGVPPVTPAETLEILAFMQAADVSKSRGGQPVLLSELPR